VDGRVHPSPAPGPMSLAGSVLEETDDDARGVDVLRLRHVAEGHVEGSKTSPFENVAVAVSLVLRHGSRRSQERGGCICVKPDDRLAVRRRTRVHGRGLTVTRE